MRKFLDVSVTYDRVSHESAEAGDTEENGYVVGSQEWPLAECEGETVSEAMNASEALREILDRGCTCSVSESGTGASFYAGEPQHTDYSTGDVTSYHVHVKGPARLIKALVRAAKR